MKKFLLAVLALALLSITAFLSEKVTTTLNLENGKSIQQYTILGIDYKEFRGMHNPKRCPTWNKSYLQGDQTSISKSCFIHFF